jgi:NADPH:quinone reductase
MSRPGYMQEQWKALLPMMESRVVKPPIGRVYELEEFGQALVDMDERRTLGKSVVRVRD